MTNVDLSSVELDNGFPSRRSLLTAVAAVPIAGVPLLAAAIGNKPDPIFALIKEAEAAEHAFLACNKNTPGGIANAIELEKTMRQAEDALRGARPQTRAGTLAYAKYALGPTPWHNLIEALKRELA